MGDDRLRELERLWRASGQDHDEAVWLGERRRAGALGDDALRAAAAIGHPASRVVLGLDGPAPLPDGPVLDLLRTLRQDRRQRVADLAALGVALAEAILPLVQDEDGVTARALEAARACVACPCLAHGDVAADAARALGAALDRAPAVPGPHTSRARWAAEVVQDVATIAREHARVWLGAQDSVAEQLAVAAWWDAERLLGRERLWAVARQALVRRWL
jgi:hypothetical protein